MNEVVIVSGTRTPVGDLLGSLKDLTCAELEVIALRKAMEAANIEPALQIAVKAGCSWETVVFVCRKRCSKLRQNRFSSSMVGWLK
jgi:acetyl-CoA C-acetyltransferase